MKKYLIACGAVMAAASAVLAFGVNSGLEVGDMTSAFTPTHLSGPDKGTDTCPVCKYGARPAVQAWVNGDSEENVTAIMKTVNGSIDKSKADLKGFVVYLTMCEACEGQAASLAKKAETAKMTSIAVTELDMKDQAVKAYKVNTDAEVKNTIFVYANRKVVAKFVNLKADEKGLGELKAAIAKAEATK
jgi:protocatechuate 3,4-dioxygenase beta subunit